MSDPILIWGAGAIGASIGARLTEAGRQVTFADADAAHVAAMRTGLRVVGGDFAFNRPVDAHLPSAVSGTWSSILLCVKAQHTATATDALAPHLAGDGHVVALQNGLTEDVVAERVGANRTIGGFVNFGADVVAPGCVAFGNHGLMRIGELDGALTARCEALAETLRLFDPAVRITSDIRSYTWGKLAYAALLYAQATGQSGIVDCLGRPELLPLWRALAGEIIRVAHAEGVRPRGFNGFDPDAFAAGAGMDDARESVAGMIRFNRGSAKTHSGVWRDLAVNRRRTEVHAHYDPVLRKAAGHRLRCPTLEKLVALIDRIEDGAPQDDRNLLDLMEVERV